MPTLIMCIFIKEIIIIFKLYVFKGLFEPFSVVYLFIKILIQEKVLYPCFPKCLLLRSKLQQTLNFKL